MFIVAVFLIYVCGIERQSHWHCSILFHELRNATDLRRNNEIIQWIILAYIFFRFLSLSSRHEKVLEQEYRQCDRISYDTNASKIIDFCFKSNQSVTQHQICVCM